MDLERRQSDLDTKVEVKLLSNKVQALVRQLVNHMKHEEEERHDLLKQLNALEGRFEKIENWITKIGAMCLFILGGVGVPEALKIVAMLHGQPLP